MYYIRQNYMFILLYSIIGY